MATQAPGRMIVPRRTGGAHRAVRPDDGRIRRTERARCAMAGSVLDRLVDAGIFQPKLDDLVKASERGRTEVVRLFGAKHLLMRHLARLAPHRAVDALGLSPEARAALSERDVKALAWAILAGRRLEPGQ